MRSETGRTLGILLVVLVVVATVEAFALARLSSRVTSLESRVPEETSAPITPLALGGEVQSLVEQMAAVDHDQQAMKQTGREVAERLEKLEKALTTSKPGAAARAPALPPEMLEETVAKLVEDRIAKMPRGQGGEWKPSLDELGEELKMTDYQQMKGKEILDDAKQELFRLAGLKRSDGTAVLDDLVAAFTDPVDPEAAAKKVFMTLFTEKIPGREEPYIAEIIRIKERTQNALAGILDKEQADRMKRMNIDYLGVQTGYDPFAEHIQASFR